MDILYVKNAAKAIRLAFEAKNLTHRIFNISQEPLSLNDIVKAAKNAIPDASIEIRPAEHFFMLMDDTRAKQELGYKPAYSFENAFKDYVEYLGQTSQSWEFSDFNTPSKGNLNNLEAPAYKFVFKAISQEEK